MISKQAYKCLFFTLPSPNETSSFPFHLENEWDNKKLYDFTLIFLAWHPTPKMGKPSKVFISWSLLVYVFWKNNSHISDKRRSSVVFLPGWLEKLGPKWGWWCSSGIFCFDCAQNFLEAFLKYFVSVLTELWVEYLVEALNEDIKL